MRFRRRPPDPRPPDAGGTAWSVLAGATGAVGLLGTYLASSAITVLSSFLLLGIATGACLFCLKPEQLARPTAAVAWWTVAAPLAAIATFGLLHAFGLYGLLATTLVVVTCPPGARGGWERLVRGSSTDGGAGHLRGHQPDHARLERDLVNLRFEELVSGLDDPGEGKDR